LADYPECTKTQDEDGLLPLHKSMKYKVSILSLLIHAYEDLGLLPLHQAIKCKLSESTILRILQANKKTAEVPDTNGVLPIQMAVESDLSGTVILALLKANKDVFKIVKPSVTAPLLMDVKCDALNDSDDSSGSKVNAITKSAICLPQPQPENGNSFFQDSIILHKNNDSITCAETFSVLSMT